MMMIIIIVVVVVVVPATLKGLSLADLCRICPTWRTGAIGGNKGKQNK